MRIPCLGPFARLAIEETIPRTTFAFARALPKTRTKAICIEKGNNPQAPVPHASTNVIGPIPVAGIAATKTITVRIMQKINGSGKNLFTR